MSELIQVNQGKIPAHLYDGYQVHRAALSRGLHVLALPRQVLLAGRARSVPSEVSFTHGVPEASTVSAVTYAQDRRLRRALLERAEVAVPKGASFTWRGLASAARWAADTGFPVVVKEVVGENPATAIRNVATEEQLTQAFQDLRRRDPGDRAPGSNPLIAGYATTRLGYEIDDEGNEVAPLRTRFLIEQQVPGQTVRALVCGGRVVAAVTLDDETQTGVEDVTDALEEGISEILIRAVDAVPGLAMATVDVVVDDLRRPPGGQTCLVVELAERPRANTYITAAGGLGDRIGDALLEFQAARAGLDLSTTRSHLSAQVMIEGLRDTQSVARSLPQAAARYDVDLTVSNRDELDGELTTICSGPPRAIALVMEFLLAGTLLDDRAASVEYSIGSSDD